MQLVPFKSPVVCWSFWPFLYVAINSKCTNVNHSALHFSSIRINLPRVEFNNCFVSFLLLYTFVINYVLNYFVPNATYCCLNSISFSFRCISLLLNGVCPWNKNHAQTKLVKSELHLRQTFSV